MKAKKLTIYREGERPTYLLGIVIDDKTDFFVFKTGNGRILEVSRKTAYSLEDLDEDFIDFSGGVSHEQ